MVVALASLILLIISAVGLVSSIILLNEARGLLDDLNTWLDQHDDTDRKEES